MSRTRSSCSYRVQSIASQIHAIVFRTCGRPPASRNHHLMHDLCLDSGQRAELLMAIELAFRVDFADGDAVGMSTVGDIIAFVAERKRPAERSSAIRRAALTATKGIAADLASSGGAIAAISLATDTAPAA
jgi:acyl carrier protein